MVTKELLEYIKSQKARGKTDDEIRADLEYNNWVEEDVEEGLQKVNSLDPDTPFEIEIKDRDKVFVIDEEASHPATQAKDDIEAPVGDKPKVVTSVLSILFAIISFLLIYRAGIMIAIMSVVNYYSYTTGAMYYFLNEFPLYGWVIMGFALSACVFLYGSFKIGKSTKGSFWFGLLVLMLLPISLSYVNYKLMFSVAKYFSTEAIIFSQGAPDIPARTSTLLIGVLGEPAFFVSVLTLIILVVSYKKFHFPNNGLSGGSRKLFLTLVLIFILPTSFMVFSGYRKANNDDFGYSGVSRRVNYHVYKPDPIPLGMIYASNFTPDKELAGRRNAIQVIYDFAYEQSPDISESRPIVLTQIGVREDFSMADFLTMEVGVYSNQKEVVIPYAKDGKGYFIKDDLSSGSSNKTLVMLTSDNVLIQISTLESGEHDLIDLAASLK
jgi:hypothetical protein